MRNEHDDIFRRKDFLWYTSFGITEHDARKNKAAALQKCIDRAYRDFSRTLSFCITNSRIDKTDLSELAAELGDIIDRYGPKGKDKLTISDIKLSFAAFKEDFRRGTTSMEDDSQSAGKYLFDRITCILKNAEQDFDCWHKKTCNGLIDISKSYECSGISLFAQKEGVVTGMSYGQAQKWVNMAMKYMLMMNLWDMDRIIPKMHIPIDNVVLGVAYKQLEDPERKRLIEPLSNGEYCVVVSSGKYKWSQIPGIDEYNKIQTLLKDCARKRGITPIKWECDTWLDAQQNNS